VTVCLAGPALLTQSRLGLFEHLLRPDTQVNDFEHVLRCLDLSQESQPGQPMLAFTSCLSTAQSHQLTKGQRCFCECHALLLPILAEGMKPPRARATGLIGADAQINVNFDARQIHAKLSQMSLEELRGLAALNALPK
jgi:hypothetical protein